MSKGAKKRARKRRGCTSKVRYGSLMAAVNAAARTGLNWYRCHWCGGWHLTSRNTPLRIYTEQLQEGGSMPSGPSSCSSSERKKD